MELRSTEEKESAAVISTYINIHLSPIYTNYTFQKNF